MKLSQIIKDCNVKEVIGNVDLDILSIECDSQKVYENSLFICINGYTVNGHEFIDVAKKRGAVAFLIDQDVECINDGYTYIRVTDTKKDMANVSRVFYSNPTEELSVIGVTGTNGKTSITTFLKEMLNLSEKKTGSIGTISIDNGEEVIASKNTTPNSLELQKHFRTMIDADCKYCAMEVSSHSLSLGRVDGVKYSVGVFTNLTPDHLDFHKNLDDYREAKQMLFLKTTLANIINIDDEGGSKIAENIKDLEIPLYTYAINKEADFMAKDINITASGLSYKVKTPEYEDDIFVPIPGMFTVYNTLTVIAVGYVLGIDKEIIKESLRNTKGVPGRFEAIQNDKGIHVIIDYAHTPDALENVITTARGFAKGKIITVFGCGGDRDSTKRPIMGSVADKLSDVAILTSDNPRTEDPDNIIKDVLKGMNSDTYKVIADRRSAICEAINMAEKDDIVLIAGKGHEDYQIIGREKIHFDDKEEAVKAIKERK